MEVLGAIDLVGSVIAALLTLMILSYLVGDNPLFRLAAHLLIGVAGGYAGAIAWHAVLRPALLVPLLEAGPAGLVQPAFWAGAEGRLLLGSWVLLALLALKLVDSSARWGTLPMVILVGVGAAVVVGGAIRGTLLPQLANAAQNLAPSGATSRSGEAGLEHVVNALILVVGTSTTLWYFRFTLSPKAAEGGGGGLGDAASAVGKLFIAITLGSIYAGVLAGALFALSERIAFLAEIVTRLLATF
jgi:hypothetical protein